MTENPYQIPFQERLRRMRQNQPASPGVISPMGTYSQKQIFAPVESNNYSALGQAINAISSWFPKNQQVSKPVVKPSPQPNRSIPTGTPVVKSALQKVVASSPTPIVSKGPSSPPLPIRIAIPSASGKGETVVPQGIANNIFAAFDPYGEATNAAQVLHHPMQISGTPGEIQQGFNHWGNIGENPQFRPEAVNQNKNGSLDTGLFQINSDTFNGMMANPYWKNALARRGITSYEQMKDPRLNALAAMLILMRGNFEPTQGTMRPNPGYGQWYGAPQALRNR